jgi:predicted Na+-dependent transporter
MFWNIFLNSLVLIVAILFIGWGIARFLERSSEKSSTPSNEEE